MYLMMTPCVVSVTLVWEGEVVYEGGFLPATVRLGDFVYEYVDVTNPKIVYFGSDSFYIEAPIKRTYSP